MRWNCCPLLGALAAFALSTIPVRAQEQLWINEYGDGGQTAATAVAANGTSGVFVGGWTTGSLGGPNLGHADVYLAQYSPAGQLVWMRQFGTIDHEWAHAVTSDGEGGAFIGGETTGNLGGPKVGYWDAFVARFDGDGHHLWSRQLGSYGDEFVSALASDGEGGVFVGGETDGSLGGPHAGQTDAFLARYDKLGNRVWTIQFGTSTFDTLTGLAADGQGGVYVGGGTAGHIGGSGVGLGGGYVAHVDKDGNQISIRQYWSGTSTWIMAIALDGMGGLYVTGATSAHLHGLNAGRSDVFVAHFDGEGDILWVRQIGSRDYDYSTALAFDGKDSVYVGGQTAGLLGRRAFGGERDSFLARFDNEGDLVWLRQFGSTWRDTCMGVSFDGNGGVYVCGWIRGSYPGSFEYWFRAYVSRFRDHGADCYADCDESTGFGVLDIFDFLCFQNDFIGAMPYACNCDESTGPGVCDILDFLCFQESFVAGCS